MLMSLLLHRRSTMVQSTASFQLGEQNHCASNTTWRFMHHHSLSLYFLLISTILILFPNGASAISEHKHIGITPRALYDITLADSAAGSSKGSPNAYNSSAGITTTTGNTVKQNASLVGSASSRRNSSSPVAGGDASLPQCGAHQNMFATNSTTGLTNKMSTGSGIAATDCYYALGHLLHMKNDVSMLQMNSTTNYTKKKSCGSCRLEIQGNYSKELFVPLDIVMFGTSQDRSGGLNGLLRQCHKRGGQVTIAARGKLSTTLRIDVSKTSAHRLC